MSTYSLTGSGIQALSAGTGALRVSVTHIPANAGFGRANPLNYYDLGLLRQGDGTDWWRSEAIDAEHMLVPLLQGMTEIGYALLNGATIDVVEVIGTSPFYQPPASGGSASLQATQGANVTITPAGTFVDGPALALTIGTWLVGGQLLIHSTTSQNAYVAKLWDGVTAYASTEAAQSFLSTPLSLVFPPCRVVLPAAATLKLSVAVVAGGSTDGLIRAATPTLGAGNNASWICAEISA